MKHDTILNTYLKTANDDVNNFINKQIKAYIKDNVVSSQELKLLLDFISNAKFKPRSLKDSSYINIRDNAIKHAKLTHKTLEEYNIIKFNLSGEVSRLKNNYFLKKLTTQEEFKSEGNELNNCIGNDKIGLLLGDRTYYVIKNPDLKSCCAFTVHNQVNKKGDKVKIVTEIKSANNKELTDGATFIDAVKESFNFLNINTLKADAIKNTKHTFKDFPVRIDEDPPFFSKETMSSFVEIILIAGFSTLFVMIISPLLMIYHIQGGGLAHVSITLATILAPLSGYYYLNKDRIKRYYQFDTGQYLRSIHLFLYLMTCTLLMQMDISAYIQEGVEIAITNEISEMTLDEYQDQIVMNIQHRNRSKKMGRFIIAEDFSNIKLMINQGFDINSNITSYNTSALILATRLNKPLIVNYLLDQNANVNLVNVKGISALTSSILKNNNLISLTLLKHGADFNISYSGEKIIYIALKNKNLIVVKEMLNQMNKAEFDQFINDYKKRQYYDATTLKWIEAQIGNM
jgi:hypothetical protein